MGNFFERIAENACNCNTNMVHLLNEESCVIYSGDKSEERNNGNDV
jgi:hypothetical protein